MFHAIRTRINATTMVAVLALVFAMTGGAYAAKKYLITSTKQISPSVLKSLQGKAGLAGANGTQGPAGAAGPVGPQGPAGGAGKEGADGQSVTSASLSKGNASCKEGGSEFTSANGKTFACNGKEGKEGPEGPKGEPWAVGGTLPAGATETGTWAFGRQPIARVTVEKKGVEVEEEVTIEQEFVLVPISFPVQLAGELNAENCSVENSPTCHVHYINSAGKEVLQLGTEVEHPVACPGTAAEPKATEGNLCVYTFKVSGITAGEINNESIGKTNSAAGASRAGAFLHIISPPARSFGAGTWAVTG